ncbi:MAG: hypothetical protein ACI9TH_004600 [Kiritimatiellia bacterium]|jgi:hypothetical protein
MPMELVRRITGHTTVEVVLKHYFRPGRAEFKKAFEAAMPKILTEGTASREAEALTILEQMTAGSLAADKERLLSLFSKST